MRLFTLLCCWLMAVAAEAAVVKEVIVFVQEDGISNLTYTTLRTQQGRNDLFLPKEEALDDYLYLYPNEFDYDSDSDPQANILHFKQGDYALIKPGTVTGSVDYGSDGIYRFRSWDGKRRPDGHFGYWIRPDDFAQFVYVWVLPTNFEFVGYRANRNGDWVQRHNTLAFYGKQLNDLTIEIDYRPKSHATFEAVKRSIGAQDEVKVEQQKRGVKVTLRQRLLFESGRAELSDSGRRVLRKFYNGVKGKESLQVVVSGHTDNVPITSRLKETYASNWELSAARSLSVVHFLQEQGMAGKQLESRAYGSYRPRSSNKSVEGRAVNRRIEIEITEGEPTGG